MASTSDVGRNTGGAQPPCTVTFFRTSEEEHLHSRVRGEFREMPALRLTIDQAMRLLMLDRPTCASIFDSLVASGFLERDETGRYGRVGCGHSW